MLDYIGATPSRAFGNPSLFFFSTLHIPHESLGVRTHGHDYTGNNGTWETQRNERHVVNLVQLPETLMYFWDRRREREGGRGVPEDQAPFSNGRAFG